MEWWQLLAFIGSMIGVLGLLLLLGVSISFFYDVWLLRAKLRVLKESDIDADLLRELAKLLGKS